MAHHPIARLHLHDRIHPAILTAGLLVAIAGCDPSDLIRSPTDTEAPVAKVELATAWPFVDIGQTLQITASLEGDGGETLSGREVQWSSSDTAVASVSGGVVTGKTAGVVTIRASAERKTAETRITVERTVSKLYSSDPTPTLAAGITVPMTAATALAPDGAVGPHSIRWTSSDPKVATVDSAGRVTGIAAGTTVITVTAGSQKTEHSLEVVAPYSVASLGEGTVPTDLNELGQVIGYSITDGVRSAFLWQAGTATALGAWEPLSINDSGVVVGSSSYPARAVRWEGGKITTLPVATGSVSAQATGINAGGEIVGMTIEAGTLCTSFCAGTYWIYRDGVVTQIVAGIHNPTRPSINDAGWVAGSGAERSRYDDHGLLYKDGQVTWLAPDDSQHVAVDVNNAGQILGGPSQLGGPGSVTGTLVWAGGGQPTHLSAALTNPHGINDAGDIVGQAGLQGGVLLRNGRSVQLNYLLANSDWDITDAIEINNRGEIIGVARNRVTGATGGVLLSPS